MDSPFGVDVNICVTDRVDSLFGVDVDICVTDRLVSVELIDLVDANVTVLAGDISVTGDIAEGDDVADPIVFVVGVFVVGDILLTFRYVMMTSKLATSFFTFAIKEAYNKSFRMSSKSTSILSPVRIDTDAVISKYASTLPLLTLKRQTHSIIRKLCGI